MKKTTIEKVLKEVLVGKKLKCTEFTYDYQSILDDEPNTYTQYDLNDEIKPSPQLQNYRTKEVEKEILDVYCEVYSDNLEGDAEIDVIITLGEYQNLCIKLDTEFELI
jgi:hypothetical protein